jgi:hypothetical protein
MNNFLALLNLLIFLQFISCKQPEYANKESELTEIENDSFIRFQFPTDNTVYTWNRSKKILTFSRDNQDKITKSISPSAADLLEKYINLTDFLYLSHSDYGKGFVGHTQFVNIYYVDKDLELKFEHIFTYDPPGLKNLVDHSEFRILAEVPDNPFDTPEQDAITHRVEQEYNFWYLCNYIQSLK